MFSLESYMFVAPEFPDNVNIGDSEIGFRNEPTECVSSTRNNMKNEFRANHLSACTGES